MRETVEERVWHGAVGSLALWSNAPTCVMLRGRERERHCVPSFTSTHSRADAHARSHARSLARTNARTRTRIRRVSGRDGGRRQCGCSRVCPPPQAVPPLEHTIPSHADDGKEKGRERQIVCRCCAKLAHPASDVARFKRLHLPRELLPGLSLHASPFPDFLGLASRNTCARVRTRARTHARSNVHTCVRAHAQTQQGPSCGADVPKGNRPMAMRAADGLRPPWTRRWYHAPLAAPRPTPRHPTSLWRTH